MLRKLKNLVSENFFASAHALHRRFDLKGSTVGRRAASRELAKGKLAVLKDLDWVAAGARLDLGVGTALLLSAIEADDLASAASGKAVVLTRGSGSVFIRAI